MTVATIAPAASADIAQAIADLGYHETAPVQLSSGGTSTYYIELARCTREPGNLRALGQAIADRLPPNVTLLAGVELGGVALAAAALAAELPWIAVRSSRKPHGVRSDYAGGKPQSDDVVAVIEDVTTTAQNALRAARIVAKTCTVGVVLTVIDREQGAGEAFAQQGYRFDRLFTADQIREAHAASQEAPNEQ